jgi:RNA polymerase-binding protein DksA
MPTLSPAQIATLKDALVARQSALLAEVREELIRTGEQHYIDLAGRVTDSGDQAVADLIADLDAAHIDRDITELREIDAALGRIAGGTYGDCPDCGAPIDMARLTAHPAALRCVRCQTQREHTYAHAATPRL